MDRTNAAPSRTASPEWGEPGSGVFSSDASRSRFARIVCVVVALLGWANVAILGHSMLAESPPTAGFDLELLLTAARRVAAGSSPYDPSVLGHGLQARDLFYSYPPFVAQFLSPIAAVPTWLVLTVWCVGAGAGAVLIASLLARSSIGRPTVAAAAPFFFPFTVAMLFGNVDAWFALLLGAVLLGLSRAGTEPSRLTSAKAGAALAIASAVKLHPGSLLIWFASRRSKAGARRSAWTTVAATIAVAAAILAASLAIAGVGPWQDYLSYLHLGSEADLASRVNIGPASQLALLVGDPGLARPLAVVVAALAVVLTIVAARLVRDPLESIGWAIVASLIVLPVTWYHYPVALIPVAIVAWTRSRGSVRGPFVSKALVAAIVVADAALALPVALWLAVGLLFLAVRRSSGEIDRNEFAPSPDVAIALEAKDR
jgi:hypothetical protein